MNQQYDQIPQNNQAHGQPGQAAYDPYGAPPAYGQQPQPGYGYAQPGQPQQQQPPAPAYGQPGHPGQLAPQQYVIHNNNMGGGAPKGLYSGEDRLGFVRKVYGILLTQLSLTTGFCILPYAFEGVNEFLVSPTGGMLLILSIVMVFVSIIALVCCGMDRKVPANYILLAIFTVCESHLVMMSCASIGDGEIVVEAACLTAGITLGLTVYAMTTKSDFTTCGAFLFMFSFGMLMFSLMCMIFGFQLPLLYSLVGVVLFGLYLIYDTQMILGGKKKQYTEDMYILAAINLYLDIINIFLYILQILAKLQKN